MSDMDAWCGSDLFMWHVRVSLHAWTCHHASWSLGPSCLLHLLFLNASLRSFNSVLSIHACHDALHARSSFCMALKELHVNRMFARGEVLPSIDERWCACCLSHHGGSICRWITSRGREHETETNPYDSRCSEKSVLVSETCGAVCLRASLTFPGKL